MNSPRSRPSIHRNDISGRKKFPLRSPVAASRLNNTVADGRDDDTSSADVNPSNERSDATTSNNSVSPSRVSTRDGGTNADDRSVSSAPIRPRLTKEQVQLEEAKAASSSSMSVSSSRSGRSQRVNISSSSISSKQQPSSTITKSEGITAPKTPTTYADEYLRAALATPSKQPHRRNGDTSSSSFPSGAATSQSSYISDIGRIYDDDPPEITSIPTDEIVDSYTRPTIGESGEGGARDTEGPEDEGTSKELTETATTTTMRGSRDEYTFGRLQARASKRREMLEQVPEEEDVTNYHSVARASRIKNIRSLYLAVEEVDEKEKVKSSSSSPVKSLLGQRVVTTTTTTSPVNRGGVGSSSPVNSPMKESYSAFLANNASPIHSPVNTSSSEQRYPIDVSSPTNKTVGNDVVGTGTVHSPMNSSLPSLKLRPGTVVSPTNQSVGNAVGSPTNQSVENAVGSPTNQSIGNAVGSPTNQSLNNVPITSPVVSPSNHSVGKLSTISVNNASVATGHNSINTGTAQSYGRKSSQMSSNSEVQSTAELSEYRVKLFAKMLHLLDDVENPGLHASATRDSHRTYEYSVEELKLIQKRTEEEMSRILNEFDRSKANDKLQSTRGEMTESRRNTRDGTSVKDCHDDHDYCSRSAYEKGPPPPNVMMSEVITSKLSDITSPTTCQDVDNTSHYHYGAVENEDEVIEGSSRNLPPRPSSPRKKRTPVFPVVGGEDGLPIVQETSDVAVGVAEKSESMDNSSRVPGSPQSIKHDTSVGDTVKVDTLVDESIPSPASPISASPKSPKSVNTINASVPTSPRSPKSVNTINAPNKAVSPKGLITTVIESIGSANLSIAQGFETTVNGSTPKAEKDQTPTARASAFFGPDMDEETPSDKYNVCLSGSEQVISPQNEARDKLLAASRNAARRTVKKQRQQEEDRFHDDIMNAVSAAEEVEYTDTPEIQRLNDEVSSFVATFDREEDEPGIMNEDGSINEEVATKLLAEGDQDQQLAHASFPLNQQLQHQQLQAPTHNQCGGCYVQ